MSEAEIMEISLNLAELFNSVFQFWLSITFAFVMAIHFTKNKLESRLYRYLCSLYAIASAIFILRAIGLAGNFFSVIGRISEAGYEGIRGGIPNQGPIIFGSILSLMFIGTIMALVFSTRKNQGINDT